MSRLRSFSAVALLAVAALFLVARSSTPSADSGLEGQVASLSSRLMTLEGQIGALEKRIARNHPDANAQQEAVRLFQSISAQVDQGRAEEARSQMAAFQEEYGGTQVAQRALALEAEIAVIGRPAPATWGVDKWYQGESEIDLTSDGPTLVIFWETWCPHCRREVPKLEALYNRYKDTGFQIVGLTRLTRNTTDQQLIDFAAQQKLSYPLAKENGTIAQQFGVNGVPAAAVVKGGIIIWRGHPARVSPAMIDAWLK